MTEREPREGERVYIPVFEYKTTFVSKRRPRPAVKTSIRFSMRPHSGSAFGSCIRNAREIIRLPAASTLKIYGPAVCRSVVVGSRPNKLAATRPGLREIYNVALSVQWRDVNIIRERRKTFRVDLIARFIGIFVLSCFSRI